MGEAKPTDEGCADLIDDPDVARDVLRALVAGLSALGLLVLVALISLIMVWIQPSWALVGAMTFLGLVVLAAVMGVFTMMMLQVSPPGRH